MDQKQDLNDDAGKLKEAARRWWEKWKRIIIGGFILFLILGVLTECNKHPAKGQKIGQIVKVANQGFLFRTCEAQLIRGGLTDGSGAISTAPFDFTIDDRKLADKAEQYMKTQTEVIISYKVSYIYFRINSENHGIYLLDIQPAKK